MTVELKPITCLAAAAVAIAARPSWGDTCLNEYQGSFSAQLQAAGVHANGGAAVYLYTSTLELSAQGYAYGMSATHALWFGMDDNAAPSFEDNSVEVGLFTGPKPGGGTTPAAVFWSEQKGSGYFEHFPSVTFAFDTWEPVEVAFSGTSCAWNAYFAGVKLGTSTSNCGPYTHSLQAGIQDYGDDTPTAHVGGNLSGWELENNGRWTLGWPGSILAAVCPADIEYTDSSHTETEEKLHGPF